MDNKYTEPNEIAGHRISFEKLICVKHKDKNDEPVLFDVILNTRNSHYIIIYLNDYFICRGLSQFSIFRAYILLKQNIRVDVIAYRLIMNKKTPSLLLEKIYDEYFYYEEEISKHKNMNDRIAEKMLKKGIHPDRKLIKDLIDNPSVSNDIVHKYVEIKSFLPNEK